MTYPKQIGENSWIIEVKGKSGDEELYIDLPSQALNQMGWDIGDTILWEEQNDGSFTLKKKMLDETYLVAFPSGVYGNFIGWLIEWLKVEEYIDYPWDDRLMNSHNNDLYMFSNINEVLQSEVKSGSLVHLKENMSNNIPELLEQTLKKYNKVIYIHPTIETVIWMMNRRFFRSMVRNWLKFHSEYFVNSYSQWNFDFDSLEPWEQREWLSYFYYKWIIEDVELDSMMHYKNDNVLLILMPELKDNLHSVVEKLCKFLNINTNKTHEDIEKLHMEWHKRQPDMFKDTLIKDIVNSIINNTDMSMENLSLVDQAEIQRMLREEHSIEIKCYKLNEWPKTTRELMPLLYSKENNDR